MMTSIVVLTSCATTPDPAPNNTTLNLSFPRFPDFMDKDGEIVIVRKGDTVEMPWWYFKKITVYKALVDEAEAKYKVYKNNENKLE